MLALQATELLMSRLDSVYRYQLYREGVISQISKLSIDEPAPAPVPVPAATQPAQPKTETVSEPLAQARRREQGLGKSSTRGRACAGSRRR